MRAFKALFKSGDRVSENGQYAIQLFCIEAMQWVSVTIDDKIPCLTSSGVPHAIFAQPDGEEIWALLLEKGAFQSPKAASVQLTSSKFPVQCIYNVTCDRPCCYCQPLPSSVVAMERCPVAMAASRSSA